MARNHNRILVPEAREEVDGLKAQVMAEKGYAVDPNHPEDTKYEVAEDVNVPLEKEYNGDLKAKQTGKVGGQMVREMIQMAENNMNKQQ